MLALIRQIPILALDDIVVNGKDENVDDAVEAMLTMPSAVMMIGRMTSMLRAPAMCSGSSEMDWKSFCYNETVTPFYNICDKTVQLGFFGFKSRFPAIKS